ncbi:PIN/TRAM domain-containing protein [Anaerovorax odorimutans]|uniref:PIN/TRAM domain-containing protein n=1 Tax=Anaerovorax odorimutans TaxID=109327 RepID=UPI0004143266|nr:PIN/TRAM domain-containing protein [Anaerovorax odorimutans]
MIRKLFRSIFTLIGMLFGFGVFLLLRFLIEDTGFMGKIKLSDTHEFIISIICAIIFGLLFFILTPTFGRHGAKVAKNIETDLQKVPTNEVVLGTFGLIIGLIIAFLISPIFNAFQYIGVVLSICAYIFMGYLGVFIATRKGNDILPAWISSKKAIVGGKGKSKGMDATPKILDTSVIIDGRIADIMKTGFIEGNIVIPEFVLVELRHIADSSDSLKRNRGRRGLDILNRIQNEYGIEIYNTVSEKSLDEIPEVDVKLLKLAQIMNGKVVTNDFNLNKVAMIKGVEVLNINELANTLKPVVLPGEDMTLFLVKEGKENNQAVAYLDDGTMIVVEEGRRYIGQTIVVIVTSVLQTSAGRMIFAKPRNSK